jgi:hypothetical protein
MKKRRAGSSPATGTNTFLSILMFLASTGAVETICDYRTAKTTRPDKKEYWFLADYATGKRRVLDCPTRQAAERRADQIRAAMVKGQAHRLALSHA